MSELERLNYHVATDGPLDERGATPGGAVRGDGALPEDEAFDNDEDAARFYLGKLLTGGDRTGVRAGSPAAAIGNEAMRHVDTQSVSEAQTRLVRFQLSREDVPVYGAQVVVEVDAGKGFVSASGRVGQPPQTTAGPTLDERQALRQIEAVAGKAVDTADLPPAQLVYFKDEKEPRPDREWHLAWWFREVPAAPSDEVHADNAAAPRGLRGPSLRSHLQQTDYLVDAHDGAILHHYRSTPSLVQPTWCVGLDEDGTSQEFFGNIVPNGFEMRDGTRHLITYDLDYADLAHSRDLPSKPVSGAQSDWRDSARAAVSAHVNAGRVHDFYKSVLQRDGIDGQGMDLVSVVKCRYVDPEYPEPYPAWVNAEWYRKTIWYGQLLNGAQPISLSRELDIMAHELTHGVIETTADLEYRGQPGALNESFADVFGTIIANWYTTADPEDRSTWTWRIGDGFGPNGEPLRNLADPPSCDQPEHMDQFRDVVYDSGGVHINSGIPNKAAYNLLTARQSGAYVLRVRDAALILYLGLLRLTKQSRFIDARDAVVAATSTLYGGNAAKRDAMVGVVRQAYTDVGIS